LGPFIGFGTIFAKKEKEIIDFFFRGVWGKVWSGERVKQIASSRPPHFSQEGA